MAVLIYARIAKQLTPATEGCLRSRIQINIGRLLELAIQVCLVSRRYVQIIGGICDTQRLVPDGVPVLQLRDRPLIPILPIMTNPSFAPMMVVQASRTAAPKRSFVG